MENPDAERPVMFRVDFLMKGIHTFRIVSQNETFELRNRVVPCSEEMKVHQLYRYDEFCRVELAIPCWGEAWGNARYCIATPHRPHWPAGLLPGIFHRIRVLRAGHPARRKFRLRGKKTFPCRLKSISKLNDMNLDMAMLNIQRSNIISGFSEKSTLEEKKSSHEEMK
ncbi:MAG: hypothetical protein LBR86_07240 [Tannerella sp.]|nr:hypothetical protein [Tannerella sp.]